jgi:hypothetical protein
MTFPVFDGHSVKHRPTIHLLPRPVCLPLELDGTDIAQARMAALPIIPNLDVLEYFLTSHCPRGEPAAWRTGNDSPSPDLLFEGSKETLHGRIVPAQRKPLSLEFPRRLMLHKMLLTSNCA